MTTSASEESSKTIKPRASEKGLIGLIRVSSDVQAEADKGGIPAQETACKQIARRHGLEIKWWIQIEGISGAQVARSPKMEQLLRLAKGDDCCGVAMKEVSRLMRPDDADDLPLLQRLKENGVKLYLPDQVIDLGNPTGNFTGMLFVALAGLERSQIRDRMLGGRYAKRSRGEWIAGLNSLSFGLTIKRVNKRNMVVVDEAKIGRVVRLFQLFISGVSNYSELARDTGIPYGSIRRILSNEIYTGWHVPKEVADAKRSKYEKSGRLRYTPKKAIPLEDRERILVLEDPPVSVEVFEEVQRLLKVRGERRGVRADDDKDVFAYRRCVRCAECGRKMMTRSFKSGAICREFYVCMGVEGHSRWDNELRQNVCVYPARTCPTVRIRRDVLEPLCDKIITQRLANKDFLLRMAEDYERSHGGGDRERETSRLQQEITQAEEGLRRNHKAWVCQKVSEDLYESTRDTLNAELKASKKALAKVKPDLSLVTPELWAPIALQLQEWGNLNPSQKRRLLRSIAPLFEVAAYKGVKFRQPQLFIKGMTLSIFPGDDFFVPIERTFKVVEVRRPRPETEFDDSTIYKLVNPLQVVANKHVA